MKRTIIKGAALAAVLVAVSVGSATAASKITASQIATGAGTSRVIADGGVHTRDLAQPLKTNLSLVPVLGNMLAGVRKNVASLPTQGLDGAYYAVAKYDMGDTNGGAVATVACSNPTDVAVSGGVRTIGLGDDRLGDNVPVSSSFPGRMDWSSERPQADRLDGWIVQFGTEVGNSPKFVNIYALCVPGADVPTVTTYVQSAN